MSKSQTAREQAMEVGLLVREAEWRVDAKLFLDEHPRWELGAPISLLSSTRCFYMLPSKGGRRQRGFIH